MVSRHGLKTPSKGLILRWTGGDTEIPQNYADFGLKSIAFFQDCSKVCPFTRCYKKAQKMMLFPQCTASSFCWNVLVRPSWPIIHRPADRRLFPRQMVRIQRVTHFWPSSTRVGPITSAFANVLSCLVIPALSLVLMIFLLLPFSWVPWRSSS